jgi:hypothetical protein
MATRTVLFWNIHQKPLYDSIASLCHSREVDFLLLAESSLNGARLLETLNRPGKPHYWPIYAQPDDLAFFATQPPLTLVDVVAIPSLDFSDLILPTTSNVLFFRIKDPLNPFSLVLVHLRSQLRAKPIDLMEGIRNVNSRIRLFEAKVGDPRTIVVGDFNLNPFDEGLIAASGFHAMMTRRLATQEGRVVDRIRHPFFYNPMWARFGCEEFTGRPPGTYYYDKAGTVRYYWNIFDQVLIRPSLLGNFRDQDLELIDADGRSTMRKKGIPNSSLYSDHLPILFKLRF